MIGLTPSPGIPRDTRKGCYTATFAFRTACFPLLRRSETLARGLGRLVPGPNVRGASEEAQIRAKSLIDWFQFGIEDNSQLPSLQQMRLGACRGRTLSDPCGRPDWQSNQTHCVWFLRQEKFIAMGPWQPTLLKKASGPGRMAGLCLGACINISSGVESLQCCSNARSTQLLRLLFWSPLKSWGAAPGVAPPTALTQLAERPCRV